MRPKRLLFLPLLLTAFCLLLFISSCSKKESFTGGESVAISEVPQFPAWTALAILKTGKNPLWFELGKDGPRLIDSPSAATLPPYAPWPHARFITDIKAWEESLVMAVNSDGFLILEAGAELLLYRVAGSNWEPYTIGSFFLWEEKPAVLLYRNDFFSEPVSPALESQVYILDRSSSVPQAVSIPVLKALEGAWEAESLEQGNDGFWYYRIKEKGLAQNETAYFRAAGEATGGEKISVGEWRDSIQREGIPPRLAELLPPLPKGFAYNSAALLGNVLAASWEEQEDAGIGASGFMVLAMDEGFH